MKKNCTLIIRIRGKTLQLSDLLTQTTHITYFKPLPSYDIEDISCDSRKVTPATIFVAINGIQMNGHDFIPQAIEAGTKVVVTDRGYKLPDGSSNIVQLEAVNPRQALSELASALWSRQPEHCVAVTGTNGKTSIAHFCQQFWEELGYNSALLGTLGLLTTKEDDITGALPSLTTLDPVMLHEVMQRLAEREITHLALEASSHGLDQYRLDGVKIKAAAFTNLTRDHLDYHKGMQSYLDAKMRLFEDIMPRGGVAVLNADIPEYAEIKQRCEACGHKIISYGFKGDEIQLRDVMATQHGLLVSFSLNLVDYRIQLPLVGEFQVSNIFAALGLIMVHVSALELEKSIAFLTSVQSVPGRMEKIEGGLDAVSVYVDYAHTPDALEKALVALQPHVRGRLHVLFGCGGDRDKGKRPLMGKIACDYADRVIVTDDNPRHEDPQAIRDDVKQGCNADKVEEIADRAKAIQAAVCGLEEGDILLVAGKGHESTQITGDNSSPFSDKNHVKQSFKIVNETGI